MKKTPSNNIRVSKDLKQRTEWREELMRYWPEMDKHQEMYEFYKDKSERSETDTDISLNTPFAIVESQIAKENQASMQITVKAKPDNDIGKFDDWVSSILYDAINDPDVAEIHGTFRKTKEKFSRALKVVGNAAAEINYCYKTQIIDGEKIVVADNPYVKTRSYKEIIFNPAQQFDRADIYYVDDYVSWEDLESAEYKQEKDGSSKGMYKNLGELKIALKESKDYTEDGEDQNISGDKKIQKKNKPIHLVTKWHGTKMTVIACTGTTSGIIIREEIDPLKLGGHNLILAMRYIIEGRPYAYGEIAAIYKPVRAQDTIVSQNIEIVNRYLRGSYITGTGIDVDQFMMVIANGGVMQGDPASVAVVPVNTPPAGAFQQIDVLQQAIERAARFSLYGAGLSGQSSDKTQGTASGIQSIQAAAEPNVEIQLDDIEEMFMNPIARKYLKMIGRLMGKNETRYGLLQGENPEWVQATKGILMGKATLRDMLTVGLLDEESYREYTMTQEPVLDPSGAPVIDMMTGQPQMQEVPIPGAEEAFLFDVDWVVEVKLDNQSAADKEEKNRATIQHIQWGLQMGIPIDVEKAWVTTGKRGGFDDIDDLLMSEEEQQAKMQEAQAEQQQQMMQQEGQLQQQAQMKQAEQQQAQQGEMQKMQMQHQMRLREQQVKNVI